MDKCKYCGSSELELENNTKFSVMDAPQVALKCAKCGKWLKWCPKDERKYYLGEFKKIAQKSDEIQIEELQKQLFNKEQEIERLRAFYERQVKEIKILHSQLDRTTMREQRIRSQLINEIKSQAILQEYRPYGADDRVIDIVDLFKILDQLLNKEMKSE